MAHDSDTYGSCKRSDGYPCPPCTQAIDLSAQIVKAGAELDLLLEQQTELHAEINNSHEPFIHRLPPEISSYIFEMTLQREWYTVEERQQLKKTEIAGPLILGAVCRTWRRVAWSSPRLWTFIFLVYDATNPELKPVRVKIAEEWLHRSGQYPLAISICARQPRLAEFPEQGDSVTRSLMPFVDLINRYSHRWQWLDIQATNDLIPYFTGNSKGPPVLDRLRIIDDYMSEVTIFSMDEIMPSPTFLSSTFSAAGPISATNLTTVQSNHLNYVQLLHLLRIARRLEHCEVYDIKFYDEISYTSPRFVHETLKLLKLDTLDPLATPSLFDKLSLPALRRLQFRCYFDDMDFNPLIDVAIRSGTWYLTSLSIESGFLNNGQLFQFLQYAPQLEEVELHTDRGRQCMDEITALLCRLAATSTLSEDDSSSRQAFLPKLHCLKITTSFSPIEFPLMWGPCADIFDPISEIGTNANFRRPLLSLSVIHYGSQADPPDPPMSTESFINESDTRRFCEIGLAGVSLHLHSEGIRGDFDVLQLSIKHHTGLPPFEGIE